MGEERLALEALVGGERQRVERRGLALRAGQAARLGGEAGGAPVGQPAVELVPPRPGGEARMGLEVAPQVGVDECRPAPAGRLVSGPRLAQADGSAWRRTVSSRPCAWAGGEVASTALNVSRTL